MSEDWDYNTWTTADLQSLLEEIKGVLEEREDKKMSEEREMIYTISAEVGPLSGERLMDWFDWAQPVGWTWVDTEEGQAYQLQTSDLKVVGENTLKLFESRIEGEAIDEEGQKAGAVWKDATQEIEWNYFYDNGERR